MAKIALIGAGSVVFTRRLLQDVVINPVLEDAEIALMDIDATRLELIGQFAGKLIRDTGSGNTVETTTDRRKALEGADYVITTIRVGDDLTVDQGIPLKYGVNQSVADTIGAGGVFKALRTVPVLLDICNDIEELAPDAWLLQYTNPMAMACWAINEATDVNAVGLCHSVQHTTQNLADYIGAPREEVAGWVAGINHMAWFLRFEHDGVDAYPRLWDALADDETYAQDPVRFEVMRHFDHFVTESTRHMSEYTPYFRINEDRVKQFHLDEIKTDLARLEKRNDKYFNDMRAEVEDLTPLIPTASEEYASRIMAAMESGESTVINGNVYNDGLITNLPTASCVEVPCLVDDLGIHPMAVGTLPPQLAALCRTNISVQELGVRAVLEGSKEDAKYAVMMDPLTSAVLSLNDIDAMFEEMWEAHGGQLAAYS